MTEVEQLKNIDRAFFIQTLLVRTIFAAMLAFSVLMTYWYFEPDPVSVEKLQGDNGWSMCIGRQYSFIRMVKSSKDVDIYVQERWSDLDNMYGSGEVESELVIARVIHDPLGKGFEKAMTFNKVVPINIPVGRYQYRPYASYQVNPIKKITRPLPVQNVEVVCDYDKDKHSEVYR